MRNRIRAIRNEEQSTYVLCSSWGKNRQRYDDYETGCSRAVLEFTP